MCSSSILDSSRRSAPIVEAILTGCQQLWCDRRRRKQAESRDGTQHRRSASPIHSHLQQNTQAQPDAAVAGSTAAAAAAAASKRPQATHVDATHRRTPMQIVYDAVITSLSGKWCSSRQQKITICKIVSDKAGAETTWVNIGTIFCAAVYGGTYVVLWSIALSALAGSGLAGSIWLPGRSACYWRMNTPNTAHLRHFYRHRDRAIADSDGFSSCTVVITCVIVALLTPPTPKRICFRFSYFIFSYLFCVLRACLKKFSLTYERFFVASLSRKNAIKNRSTALEMIWSMILNSKILYH